MKTYKELLNEIEEKTKGSVGAKKLGTILSKGTKEMAKNLRHDSVHNRRMNNPRDKETDTHYETHFDSDHEKGLVTRIHKKTGKVEHNFGVEYHKAYRDKAGNKYIATSNFKKHPNGEFK